ncbi:hypothetical protein BZA05DRAFT_432450 [Tricharina praecox]|uniref:uncharacterized protein n=1 Tax=Tricharina praecox TaxID=43433 RepID=UPI00221F7623|nr:uncharacterized protein BZA05DRAFT_432450 [Tricharina praecox]KAI5858546.1 hypothetical protein BZA05DRAFT_432450 [Tricharina praecox]
MEDQEEGGSSREALASVIRLQAEFGVSVRVSEGRRVRKEVRSVRRGAERRGERKRDGFYEDFFLLLSSTALWVLEARCFYVEGRGWEQRRDETRISREHAQDDDGDDHGYILYILAEQFGSIVRHDDREQRSRVWLASSIAFELHPVATTYRSYMNCLPARLPVWVPGVGRAVWSSRDVESEDTVRGASTPSSRGSSLVFSSPFYAFSGFSAVVLVLGALRGLLHIMVAYDGDAPTWWWVHSVLSPSSGAPVSGRLRWSGNGGGLSLV